MSKKKNTGGLVYSTNPDAYLPEEEEITETLPKEEQKLRVSIATKHRGGKIVTIVSGFIGNRDDLNHLGKQLKTKCGTGGTVKDGEIIIQGNEKEKVIGWLKDWGYKQTK